jgi:translation elongation factor EF-1alpha
MSQFQKRFGNIAVEKGFITADQLVEAFKVQVMEEIEKGKHRLIGAILYEQGLISMAQIDEVVESLQTLSAF